MATVRLDVPSNSKDAPGHDPTIDRDSQFYKEAVESTLDGGRTDFYDVAHLKGKRMYWIETDVASPRNKDPNADTTDMIGAIISPTRKGKFSLPTKAPEERPPLNIRGLPLMKGAAGQRQNKRTVADVYGANH